VARRTSIPGNDAFFYGIRGRSHKLLRAAGAHAEFDQPGVQSGVASRLRFVTSCLRIKIADPALRLLEA
jgi:hypothetical protein